LLSAALSSSFSAFFLFLMEDELEVGSLLLLTWQTPVPVSDRAD
jgi:hypothetical protein